MRTLTRQFIIFILWLILSNNVFAFTHLFYALRGEDIQGLRQHFRVLHDLKIHHQQINILVPQSYYIDQYGTLAGTLNSQLQQQAKKYQIKLMPLITNLGFDQTSSQQFLQDPRAQQRAIKALLELCKKNKFYGVQIDFEHLQIADSDKFTAFYQNIATVLHKAGYKISIAIVPNLHNVPLNVRMLKVYNNWSGIYQLKALAKSSDFVSLMTYNQHGGNIVPGPVTSVPWMKKALQLALQSIPADKLSLGIPTYSIYWSTQPLVLPKNSNNGSKKPNIKYVSSGQAISYQDVFNLIKARGIKLRWDPQAQDEYAMYTYNDLNQFLFVENSRSFASQLALAKKHHLHGISVFRLGIEDEKIWTLLK